MSTPPGQRTQRTERTTRGEAETIALAADLARALEPGDVVALHGELGSGKTRFVRGLAAGLGLDAGRVSSPTFVLVHEYTAAGPGPVQTLVHVDAYRLDPDDDPAQLGLDALVDAGAAVLAVEWAERIDAWLPAPGEPGRWDVRLEHAPPGEPDDVRRVVIDPPAGRVFAG